MLRVVLDPNVLISGLITPRGASAHLLVALRDGAFELVASPLLLAELETVLRRPKFRKYVTVDEVTEFVDLIRRVATVANDPPMPDAPLSADPGDEYLISLAREERVNALVSGDPHLLRLRSRIPARTTRELLDQLAP